MDLQTAAQRLRALPTEALAEFVPPVRKFLRTKPASFREIGRGWRVGVLIVDTSGQCWSAGASLRAHQPPEILGYTSESARERDALRAAAIRGGFVEGEVVHYDCVLQLAQPGNRLVHEGLGPIAVRDGELVVRWTPGCSLAQAAPLGRFLAERVELALTSGRSQGVTD